MEDDSEFAVTPVVRTGALRPVIVALDGSGLAARAVPVGVLLARRRQTSLLLMRVAPPESPADMFGYQIGERQDERAIAEEYLAREVARVRKAHPEFEVSSVVLSGTPSRALIEAQAEHSPQLTIVTSHGRSALARMIRGSVTEELIRGTTGSTLVLWPWSLPDRPSTDEPVLPTSAGTTEVPMGRRILVPLDGSARTARVVPEAFRLARDAGGEVLLLSVLDLHGVRPSRALDLERAVLHALEQRATTIEAAGVPARVEVIVSPDVAGSIISAAARCQSDTIAMTTHARGALGKFVFGSVANRVASRAARTVLFTPPHDGLESFEHVYPDVPPAILDLAALPH